MFIARSAIRFVLAHLWATENIALLTELTPSFQRAFYKHSAALRLKSE